MADKLLLALWLVSHCEKMRVWIDLEMRDREESTVKNRRTSQGVRVIGQLFAKKT